MMYSKVMIVVKKFHWCCISCKVVNRHLFSIDEHLKVFHNDLLSCNSDTSLCLSDFEHNEFSDSDLDLCSQLNKTDEEEPADHSQDIPDPSPTEVQRKPAAENNVNKTNLSKGRTKDLSSRTSANISKSETSQSKSRTKNLPELSESSTSKSSTSADISEAKPPHEVCVRVLRKNSHTLSKLTSIRKQSQQLIPDSNSRNRPDSKPMKRLSKKQEYSPPRKRLKQKLDSKNEDLCEEDRCSVDNDIAGVKVIRNSKESVKSSTDKSNTDADDTVPRKKTGRGRPKGSGNKKVNFGKFLKDVDVETKRPGLGGKPVKRSLEISEKEMKSLKLCYIGSQQAKKSKDEILNTELVVPVTGNIDEMCLEYSPHNGHRESADENEIMVVKVNKPKHLNVAENDSELKTTAENTHNYMGSGVCENSCQNLTSDGTGSDVALTGEHTDITEASSSRADMAETNGSGISYQHGGLHSYQSSGLYRLKECHEAIPAVSQNLLLPTHVTTVSSVDTSTSTAVNPTQVFLSLEHTYAYTDDCRFQNSLQTDTVCSEQNVSKVIEIVERERSNIPEQCKTTECEEWMKNKTTFSFTKTKPAAYFQQPSKIYECTVCPAKFSAAEFLSDHDSKMSTYSPADCQNCQRSFHSIYDLNFHVFGDHEKRSKPFCFECEKKFQSMEIFEKHLHQHMYGQDPKLLDMEYHSCNICRLDVPCRYDTLRKHYYNKHKATICLECFVRSELVLLSDSALLREHKKTHANFCSVCLQDFSSVEPLHSHSCNHTKYLLKEDGQGKLCERCNQWCPNRASAVLHHKEHKLQIMRNWRVEKWGIGVACVHCDKVLRNKRNLQRHIAQLHSSCRSYNYQCEFCGKGIDSRNILKDHIAVHHLGIKRYSCEFCDQRFACAPTLRRHILKVHATDRQYTCEECGERFCEKFKLTRHMYVHTGSARFMCEHCGKGFHSSSEFKKHTAVHAEKREFVCQGCGQEYKRNEHLKRHVQRCTRSVHTVDS